MTHRVTAFRGAFIFARITVLAHVSSGVDIMPQKWLWASGPDGPGPDINLVNGDMCNINVNVQKWHVTGPARMANV